MSPQRFSEYCRDNHPVAGVVVSLIAVVVAFLLRRLMESLTGGELPLFVTFYPAVVFVAFLVGWIPGVIATIVSAFMAAFFVVEPRFSFGVNDPNSMVALVLFVVTGCGISYMASRYVRIEKLVKANESRALELTHVNEKKDEYMAVLAHELRNPLSAILNGVELIRMSCQGTCGGDVPQVSEILLQQTRHISRLIDDLLDISRFARGKVQIHPCRLDLSKIVKEACDCHRMLFKDRNLKFEVVVPEKEVWCEADPIRVMQIIGNLVCNAIKFTASGSVKVVLQTGTRTANIIVQDTGCGIESDLLPHIFEPFIQADQGLARSKSGLGLGLALVKGLANLHNGKVSVVSNVGQGSIFTVTLPLSQRQSDPCPPQEVRPLEKRHRILAIDDAPHGLFMLRGLLKKLGQEIETAENGLTGLEKALEMLPEIILCDIGLPDIDGYEVARRIRRQPQLDQVRLIAITGYSRDEDKQLAMEAGFDEHIAKPVSVAQLQEILS